MIGLIGGVAFFFFAIWALRSEGIRWQFTILLALIPAACSVLLGMFGFIMAAVIVGAYWKIDMSARR